MADSQNTNMIISKDILEKMVAECAGDRQKILDRAKRYVIKNRDLISSSMFKAGRGLIIINGSLEGSIGKHKLDLKEVTDMHRAALKLRNMLPSSNDLRKGKPALGAVAHIRKQIHKHDYRHDDLGAAAGRARLEDWTDFLISFESQILMLEDVKKFLSNQAALMKNRPSGPKATTRMLAMYVNQVAQLYEHAAKKPFTVNNPKDGISVGTLFVQASMPALYNYIKGLVPQHENFIRYTDSKVLNACDYVIRDRNNVPKI